MINKKQQSQGFTLVEMLVSVALFAVTVTISMGSLLVLIDANAKSQTVQNAVTNMSFAVDSMTRIMRTGTDYYCADFQSDFGVGLLPTGVRNCATDHVHPSFVTPVRFGEAIVFTDTRTGDRYAYARNGNSLQRRIDVDGSEGEWQSITGQNVRVTDFRIYSTGNGNAANTQPVTTFYIKAEVGDISGLSSEIELQTSVSQRRLRY